MNRILLFGILTVAVAALFVSACTSSTLPSPQTGNADSSTQGASAGTAPQLQATPVPTTTVTISPSDLVGTVQSALTALSQFEGAARVSALVGDTTIESRVNQWYKNPHLRLETYPQDQVASTNPNVFLYDGREWVAYFPDTNQVVRVDRLPAVVIAVAMPERNAFPLLAMLELRPFLIDLLAHSSLTIDGGQMIAGRPTTLVVAVPQTTTADLGIAHIFLDQSTFYPLRVNLARPDGTTTFDLEYLSFNPGAQVSDEQFAFQPPADATVLSPNLDTLTVDLGLTPATIAEAQQTAGFPVLVITTPPAGVVERFVRTATVQDRTTVLIFYGTEDRITTTLIENAAGQGFPELAGSEPVDINGNPGQVAVLDQTVMVRWTQGETALTLVTERSREDAITLARLVGQ